MGRSMLWAAVAAACIAQPQIVLAGEPDNASQADESFHAGRALLKDKRYADACPKFEQSQRQDPASGTLLALAYCQELSGLLATSWTNYLAAAQLAEREGQSDRQSAAAERATAISARFSKLTVVVPSELLSLPGFHLLRDGIEFERASFGLPVPTDGGTHAFQATAPGRVPWSSTVTLLPEHDQKTLILPVLDPVPPPSSAPARANSPAPPPSDYDAAHRSEIALKRVSLAVAAASIIGLGVGTGFALSAKSKNDDSNANGCTNDGCDANGTRLRNDALSAARVSTWSFVASGVLAAGSITLYLTANSLHSPSNRGARIQGNVSLGAPSVTFATSF